MSKTIAQQFEAECKAEIAARLLAPHWLSSDSLINTGLV